MIEFRCCVVITYMYGAFDVFMSRTSFRVILHSIVFLNVKELLAWSRRYIWSLSDSNGTGNYNHSVCKRTLNPLGKYWAALWVLVQGGQWFFPKKFKDFFKEFSRIFFRSQGHEKIFWGLLNKCFKKTLDSNWT